ncbi:MAG TPA: hypothetical protein VMU35_00205 [Methylomirabilota bacterium]|nr:hypothetical protein [Methylomirabilota bacterium]
MGLSGQVLGYEGGNRTALLDCVHMSGLGGDPTLVALIVGSTILYYWQLYNLMRRNKIRSGSYWKD